MVGFEEISGETPPAFYSRQGRQLLIDLRQYCGGCIFFNAAGDNLLERELFRHRCSPPVKRLIGALLSNSSVDYLHVGLWGK